MILFNLNSRPRGGAQHLVAPRDISQNDGAGTYYRMIPHGDALHYLGARADMHSSPKRNPAANNGTRRNVAMIANAAIVIHQGPGIEDRPGSDIGIRLDDSASHDLRSLAQGHSTTDDRRRVDKRRKLIALLRKLFVQHKTESLPWQAPEAVDQAAFIRLEAKYRLVITDDLYATPIGNPPRCQRRVAHGHDLLAQCLHKVQQDLRVPPSTEHHHGNRHQRASPAEVSREAVAPR